MSMFWLKYVRLNRKDRLKNMRGATLEVAILLYSAISSLPMCDSLRRGPSSLPLDVLDSDWSTKR